MEELKACIVKLLADNFPAYADWEEDWLYGASAEDIGDILAHVAYVFARDEEHLQTFREDGDRFKAICDSFVGSAERCEVSRRCKADFAEYLRSLGPKD